MPSSGPDCGSSSRIRSTWKSPAEAASGSETVSAVRAADFDVVLLDISMPDKNGIDTLRAAAPREAGAAGPDAVGLRRRPVRGEPFARRRVRISEQGSGVDQLVGAIRTVVQGRKYVSPSLAQILADGVSGDGDKPLHAELSQREFQIFCKLASGAAVSKIADELNLSVKTVSTYRTRILEKMAMKSNADLTYYAIKNGLIE